MRKAKFDPTSATPTTGWGGVTDESYAIGAPPGFAFAVGDAAVFKPTSALPRRLRARYYWMHARPRARLAPNADPTNWRNRHRLEAVDVLLYEQPDGAFSGLVTSREPRSFRTVVGAVGTLATGLDKSVQLSTDQLPGALSEDFFLWLVYRLQDLQQLSPNLSLAGIGELSSKDRSLRPARFSETVTMERIELAALIAMGEVRFGPAKIDLNVTIPALGTDVSVHPDGGFQPLRSSTYDDVRLTGGPQATRLIDDLWIIVLPQLREAYAADGTWQQSGRTELREKARDQVRALLRATK